MPDTLEDNVACRICMDPKDSYVSLFTHDLSQKVMEIADVQVGVNDGLPGSICTECEQDLEKCYEFRLKVQVSDKKFRENIRHCQVDIEECNIKEERYMEDKTFEHMDDKDSVSMDDDHYDGDPDIAQNITDEPAVADPDPLNHVVVVEENEKKIEISQDQPVCQTEDMTEEPQLQKIEEVALDGLGCLKEEAETEIMDVDNSQPDPFGPSSSGYDLEHLQFTPLTNDGSLEKKKLQPKQTYLTMYSNRRRKKNKTEEEIRQYNRERKREWRRKFTEEQLAAKRNYDKKYKEDKIAKGQWKHVKNLNSTELRKVRRQTRERTRRCRERKKINASY